MGKHKAGDKVRLISSFGTGNGSLNSLFLSQEGYTGQSLRIQELDGDGYIVILPSNYNLRITDKDICS